MLSKNILAAAVASVILAGCTMAPEYERPASPVAASFPSAYAETGKEDVDIAKVSWKEFFLEPELRALIETALENNRDLRVAALNIESAKALYQIQRSNLIPNIDASGAFTRQRVPENASATGQSYTASTSSLGIGVTSYELDLFGRVRSLKDKALENYFATEEARNTAQISLISEVANVYFAYLGDKELLQIAEDTLKTQEESYSLVKRKYELGTAALIDLEQAATSVESAKISKAQYTRQVAQDLNALTLIVGTEVTPSVLNAKLPDETKALKPLSAGISSETLLNRPDIKQAEHSLKAANADIGAARAAFFPSITLTGSFGLASGGLDDLFESGSATAWNFSPRLNIPIFTGGRNKANLENAKVSQKIAAAKYEKAIQIAFKEVADQLTAKGTYTEQLESQKALAESSRSVYELAEKRYQYGISGYLQVLDAQRSLFSAEQGVVAVKLQYLNNLVTLYKALGGGQI